MGERSVSGCSTFCLFAIQAGFWTRYLSRTNIPRSAGFFHATDGLRKVKMTVRVSTEKFLTCFCADFRQNWAHIAAIWFVLDDIQHSCKNRKRQGSRNGTSNFFLLWCLRILILVFFAVHATYQDANVHILLIGDQGRTEKIILKHSLTNSNKFERGCLGTLHQIAM